MSDPHYTDPRLAAVYDTDSPWSADRDYYLALSRPGPINVLDLGCGTGLLCAEYAKLGNTVVGVDPAASMLAVALARPFGDLVDWVQAQAQDFRADRRFNLVVMTGHAFQVLLTDQDIRATFATIRHHLAPDGIAVFETRNPGLDWAKAWTRAYEIRSHGKTVRVRCQTSGWQGDLFTFEHIYQFEDAEIASVSTLRFPAVDLLRSLLGDCGLRLVSVQGDWQGGPFDPARSEEIILRVKLPHGKGANHV